MYLKGILIILISRWVFDFLFGQLDKVGPKILSPFHKIPERWKGKWIIKWIAIFILIFIWGILVVNYGLSDMIGTILVGFSISFCELVFREPLKVNK